MWVKVASSPALPWAPLRFTLASLPEGSLHPAKVCGEHSRAAADPDPSAFLLPASSPPGRLCRSWQMAAVWGIPWPAPSTPVWQPPQPATWQVCCSLLMGCAVCTGGRAAGWVHRERCHGPAFLEGALLPALSDGKSKSSLCACSLHRVCLTPAAVMGPMVAAGQGGPLLPAVAGAWATALLTAGLGLMGGGGAAAAKAT